jgi:methylmalonyl-CoA carboxyltransferase 1.3S subunit
VTAARVQGAGVREGDGLKLRITIGGNTYLADVEVLEEEDAASTTPVMAYAPSAIHPEADVGERAGGVADKTCRSPVTGMVIRIPAEAGQAVEAGQVLVVLEAMKMETRVTAPCAGTVAKVHVAAGISVKAGQVLVEMA